MVMMLRRWWWWWWWWYVERTLMILRYLVCTALFQLPQKFVVDQNWPYHYTEQVISLWHHPLSSKNVLSISSSILSTTRCGELYYCHNGEIQGKVFCIAVNLFDGERIQSPQSIALIALLNWAQNIYLNQHMCVHQYISLESSTAHQYSLRKYFWGFFINQKLAGTAAIVHPYVIFVFLYGIEP